jgi:hypothetical protein
VALTDLVPRNSLARSSIDSWGVATDDGSELGSMASLQAVAPGGVRPADAATAVVRHLGTSRKRVSFSEYSEQWTLPHWLHSDPNASEQDTHHEEGPNPPNARDG